MPASSVDDEMRRSARRKPRARSRRGVPRNRGLKKQNFLIAQGKHIVPTETGLSLFGVLKQADPALVDRGVTAQLECLLDDVVVGNRRWSGQLTPCAMSRRASSAS